MGRPVHRAPRRTPSARPRNPSTGASRSTSRRAWRSSASSSPHCSPRKTVPSAWTPSSTMGPARPASRAADRRSRRPSGVHRAARKCHHRRGRQGPKKRPGATTDALRARLARIVRIVFGVLATILALGAVLVVLGGNINEDNSVVKFIIDTADAISGPFSKRRRHLLLHRQERRVQERPAQLGYRGDRLPAHRPRAGQPDRARRAPAPRPRDVPVMAAACDRTHPCRCFCRGDSAVTSPRGSIPPDL